MTDVLLDDDYQKLKQSLPTVFQAVLENKAFVLLKAYPLLNMICKDQGLIQRLKIALKIPQAPKTLDDKLLALCQMLEANFQESPLFPYRLPTVLSEFPIHSRQINKAIKAFNTQVEALHEDMGKSTHFGLEEHYREVLKAISNHGSHCDRESLWQLIEMMTGWSLITLHTLIKEEGSLEIVDLEERRASREIEVEIVELEQPKINLSSNPFTQEYNYNFNGAGRIAFETSYLLLNAFGMKIGGHFDAQVKYAPRFIPIDELHSLIRRQLSHRLVVPQSISFQLWLEVSLNQLGVRFIQRQEKAPDIDLLVNPFLSELIGFLSPEKIQATLKEALGTFEELELAKAELDIIAQYLFELLQGFQINPGLALGIGANWDGTVNLSNEAGTYAFKFNQNEEQWGRRFKQLSLHRQGPSEAKMNAAIGIKFEAQALFSSFEYMSQLQPSEYKEVVYNALIDNLVCDLMPEPAYFENSAYEKFQKQHVVHLSEDGLIQIDSFFKPSHQGTYFKDKEGNPKQTPMYRRAGTLDVLAFPKNNTYSEQSRVCYEGNPLGPLQLQYAQAMHKSVRGHLAYNPIGPDEFIEDVFYGQVILTDYGDYLPFIGVIPKNFDRHFKQDNELCASFVIRMLQSARLVEHCPSFSKTLEKMKGHFLPLKDSEFPLLPKTCSYYLIEKRQTLISLLAEENRNVAACERQFFSLFKNLIYSLYEFGKEDSHFKHIFLSYINSYETFHPMNRAKCEKLIRDLSVNRPVQVLKEAQASYDDIINYLKASLAYFYPKPTDSLAQELARYAKAYAAKLVRTKAIQDYFINQQDNKQSNLSRKQTPGMLFSAFKNNGPSNTIAKDYYIMHSYNFPSYYRDSDGVPNGEPQFHESLMDFGAKILGMTLQVMQRYNLFAILRYPISQTIVGAKQGLAIHHEEKFLGAMLGGLEGLLFGLGHGILDTVATPFIMMWDFLEWQLGLINGKESIPLNNPLALSAAPSNEPSIKALAASQTRDFLLSLLGKAESRAHKKREIINYALQWISKLYPYLLDQDKVLCANKLHENFPLTDEELNQLFKPLLATRQGSHLSALLSKYNPYINKSLLQAVIRCLTNPLFTSQSKAIIEEANSFFGLNSKQMGVLAEILKQPNPENWFFLFQFGGTIHKALLIRDRLIQKIQGHILQVFDEQWIKGLCPLVFNIAKIESIKDRAHQKWADFSERELRHQLLSIEQVDEIVCILSEQLKGLPLVHPLIRDIKEAYPLLDNQASLSRFYHCIVTIDNCLTQEIDSQAKVLLNNFLNITMNAVINARLDKVDIFDRPQNPLQGVRAIEDWLIKLAKNNQDLRSFLEQQTQQSASLDHALWRCKCLMQVLEKQNPHEKVAKSGLGPLLRFWCQHEGNVKLTGEKYANPLTGEADRGDYKVLFEESVTMEQALRKAQSKLPYYSIFRVVRAREERGLDYQDLKVCINEI